MIFYKKMGKSTKKQGKGPKKEGVVVKRDRELERKEGLFRELVEKLEQNVDTTEC